MNQFYVDPAISRAVGSALGGIGQGIMQGRQDELKQQQEAEKQAAMQAKLEEASQVMGSGDPMAISDFMLRNPDMQQAVTKANQFRNDATKQQRIKSLLDIRAGRPVGEAAAEAAEFIRSQGGTTEATDAFGQLPQEQAMRMAEAELATLLPPDQFKSLMSASGGESTMQDDGRTAGMKDFDYYQKLKRENPEAARQFGVERGFVSKEGRELSGHMQKRLSSATDDAIEAGQNIGRYTVLAEEIEEADFGGGLFGGSWAEWLKENTGTQDAVSDLRRKYAGIRASQVVNNLPPGAASDKDIEMAMGGFPSNKATSEQLASFVRGLAKLEGIREDYANFRSDYISENGSERGMLSEWKKSQRSKSPQSPKENTPTQTINWADM